jgi:hypothetical protein
MFLAPPDLTDTDAYYGVHAPAVLTSPDGTALAVGATRPAAALDLIRAAAPGGLVPTRADAAAFRLRWFAYTHPARPRDPVTRGRTRRGRRVPGRDLARRRPGRRATRDRRPRRGDRDGGGGMSTNDSGAWHRELQRQQEELQRKQHEAAQKGGNK